MMKSPGKLKEGIGRGAENYLLKLKGNYKWQIINVKII